MSLEIWLAYVLAATLILVIPGPTIILVISQTLVYGKRSAIPLVTGVVLGDFTAMVLSLMGLGALLSISASLFSVLKWIGAAYLVFLGISKWCSRPTVDQLEASQPQSSNRSLFKSSYIITSLNPKGIVFFVAFLPQFLSPDLPTQPQILVMGATFLILAGINAALYASFAGQLRELLQSPNTQRWINRAGGTALIGAGLVTAAIN